MFKRDMTPLTPGGDTTIHQGKGSRPFTGGGGYFNSFGKPPAAPSRPAPTPLPAMGPGTGAQPAPNYATGSVPPSPVITGKPVGMGSPAPTAPSSGTAMGGGSDPMMKPLA